MTQTAVIDMYNLGLLNIAFFHQYNTKNTIENNDMIINGVTITTNTLNIALDGAKSLSSEVWAKQSNDMNICVADPSTSIGANTSLIAAGYLKSIDIVTLMSWI